MPSIEIDGEIYQVQEGTNLLQAVLSLGMNLPYFCWHPAMGSVGACRQCAVIQYQDRHDQPEGDKRDQVGRLVMSCMTQVSEGMRVSLQAEAARDFRADIIGMLMENHPHDCPVCEEGGECHLQDMTVMTGHTFRDYRGLKRTHRNQYLGPFINHEMNRCIACYRCVRFYNDYAGGADLQALAAHHHVYFGRHEDGALENEFSGNLVEVCPTGVFTDKTFSEHYTRKWDLQTAPSICTHCAHGCNISPGERYGKLRRIVNRYNSEVNGYFLCDRGRFGYGFVNHAERLLHSVQHKIQDNGGRIADRLTRAQTRDLLATLVAKDQNLIGIGSPRASLEANFALRELVGADNFYIGCTARESQLLYLICDILTSAPVVTPTLEQIEQSDAVLVLGEDLMNSAPRVALALRQSARNAALGIADELRIPHWQDAAVREAAQQERSPVFIASILPTRLDDIATDTFRATPERLLQFGCAIAHLIEPAAPHPAGLSNAELELAGTVAECLKSAKRPLIVSGMGCHSAALIRVAANIAIALSRARSNGTRVRTPTYYCLPESNSLGLALLTRERPQQHLDTLMAQVQKAGLAQHSLLVLECDLTRKLPLDRMQQLYAAVGTSLVLDHSQHAGAAAADVLLPAAPFAETQGTLVSAEGRAQRYFPAYVPPADVRGSWEWLSDLIALREGASAPAWQHPDAVIQACVAKHGPLAGAEQAAPSRDFRIEGMKVARMPHRASGRTAMLADVRVAEPKQPDDPDSPLAFSMEGFPGAAPPSLTPYYWSPGWNSNQSVAKFQHEVGGHLRGGDPGVRLFRADGPAVSANWYDLTLEEAVPAFAPRTAEQIREQRDQRIAEQGFLLLPRYHLFGSEELSSRADAIAERSPEPSLSLHPDDAGKLQLKSGDGVRVELAEGGMQLSLRLQTDACCHRGTALVSAGFAKTACLVFMTYARLEKDPHWQGPLRAQIIVSDRTASLDDAQRGRMSAVEEKGDQLER